MHDRLPNGNFVKEQSAKKAWISGLPERYDGISEKIDLRNHLEGIPTEPVMTMAFRPECLSHIREYDNRSATFGGIRIVSRRTPAEIATDYKLRPTDHVIEVGQYPPGVYDLTVPLLQDSTS